MASINTYLTKIKTAVYGEEVRGSIHDAIKAINDDNVNVKASCEQAKAAASEASKQATTAMESATKSAQAAAKNAETVLAAADKLSGVAEQLQTDSSQAKEDIANLKTRTGALETAKETLTADVTDLKGRTTKLETAKTTLESNMETMLEVRKDILKSTGVKDALLDSSGNGIRDSTGNEIFGRVMLQTTDGVNDLRKRTDTLEFQTKELESARQTLTDEVSDLLEFKDDILGGAGISIPLLDSSGNAIMDSMRQNVCGRLMIPTMADVMALSQKLAALDAVVTSILSGNLNSRVLHLERHALLDSAY